VTTKELGNIQYTVCAVGSSDLTAWTCHHLKRISNYTVLGLIVMFFLWCQIQEIWHLLKSQLGLRTWLRKKHSGIWKWWIPVCTGMTFLDFCKYLN